MRRGWILALGAAALALGVAGCIGNADLDAADADEAANRTPDEAATFVPPVPEEDFHDRLPVDHPDHQNPEAHTEGIGLSLTGHTDFQAFYPPQRQGGWTEVDVQGHLAAVASYVGMNGITLVDIEDPSDPTPVGFVPSAGDDYDARISEDGEILFFGCQPGATEAAEGAAGDCRSTQPGEASGQTSGVVAYDITDPSEPTFAGFADGVATHNIWTSTIEDEIYVFTNGVEILRFTPEEGLEQVAEVPGGHDAYVHEHPATGDHLLYTTSQNTFAVYEVNDPADPEVVLEEGPEVTGWHQQRASTELIDGRVLLVVGGEVFENPTGTYDGSDPPLISVLDVTEPAEPELLSQWTLPVEDLPPWVNYRFSPHNIDISPHGQISVAWNHAGIWVFDVSTQQRQEDPVTLAFYQPHELPPLQPPTLNPTGDASVPRVWGGAFDQHGYLVTADMYTGLYVLEPRWGLYG